MMKTNRRGAADEDFDDAFDERGVLKQHDQHGQLVRARVPMMLRDAAARDDRREVQRQIKADAAAAMLIASAFTTAPAIRMRCTGRESPFRRGRHQRSSAGL